MSTSLYRPTRFDICISLRLVLFGLFGHDHILAATDMHVLNGSLPQSLQDAVTSCIHGEQMFTQAFLMAH